MPELLSIRECWDEWNRLVPIAQARGVRVRPRAYTRTSRTEANARLQWLLQQIGPVTFLDDGLPLALRSQTFGVELEVLMPAGMTRLALAERVSAAGVECHDAVYTHAVRPHWKIVTDGSLGNLRRGAELVSPVLTGADGFEQIRKVCRVLVEAGCKVSKKCGLHVHVGVGVRGVEFFKRMLHLYRQFDGAFDSVMAPSRRGSTNSFCLPVYFDTARVVAAQTVDELPMIAQARSSSVGARCSARFRKLNVVSWLQHKTVEFRQHQGTVEARKAEMWVRLCLRITHWAAGEAPLPHTDGRFEPIETLLTLVEADQSERAFFIERRTHFNQIVARRETRMAA